MVGKLTQQDSGLNGQFFNGSSVGSFNLRASVSAGLESALYTFNGTWGYGNRANIGSTDANNIWTGNRMGIKRTTTIKNALWSGKWNTPFGYLILEQVGNKVTGKYDNKGILNAIYNKNAGTLEGTFTNAGKTDYFNFQLPIIGASGDRNFFKGQWGWTNKLEKGA